MVRLLLPLIALLLILPTSAQAAFTPAGAIVVNSTADTGKRCDDPTATECTLRGAINQANFNAGPDTITFNLIGPAKFTPATPLPPITQEVTIDGSGGGTVPKVEIDGSLIPEDTRPALAATGALAEPLDKPKAKATRSSDDGVIRFLRPWGLDLRDADSSTIRGLIIHSFPYAQIGMDGTDAANIKGNWLGLKPDGSLSQRKSTEDRMLGLSLINSAINVIGGPGADKNVISGTEIGVVLMDQGAGNANHNLVYGNYIGTTTDGLGRRPNTETGILLTLPTNLAGRGTEENRILGNVVVGARDGSYGISVLAAKKTEISSNFVGDQRRRHARSRRRARRSATTSASTSTTRPTRDRRHRPGRVQHRLRQHARHRGQRRLGPHHDRRQPDRYRLLRHDRRAQRQRRRRWSRDGLAEAPADVTVNQNTIAGSTNYGMYITGGGQAAHAHQQPLRHRRRRRQAAREQDRLRDRRPRQRRRGADGPHLRPRQRRRRQQHRRRADVRPRAPSSAATGSA